MTDRRLGDLPADLGTRHGAHLDPQAALAAAVVRAFQVMPGQSLATSSLAPLTLRFKPFSFIAEAGSSQYLTVNERRRYLLLQNNTGADVWLNLDSAAAVGRGIKIVTGGSAEWYRVIPSNAIMIFSAAGGGSFSLWEA